MSSTSTLKLPIRTVPVVCLDENPVQLIGETRTPVPARPGQPWRFDYEYRRNGTANLSLLLDAHQGWRKVKVTERRTAADFAACMRDPGDLHFPEAEKIRVVLDNLSTHTLAALYTALPAENARRIRRGTKDRHAPTGCSRPQTPGTSWRKPTPNQVLQNNQSKESKSL